MDNSENGDCADSEPSLESKNHTDCSKSVESDVDFPLLKQTFMMGDGKNIGGIKNGISEVTKEESDQQDSDVGENGVTDLNGGENVDQDDNVESQRSDDDHNDTLKNDSVDVKHEKKEEKAFDSSEVLSTVKADPEIPFSQYLEEEEMNDEVKEVNGSWEHFRKNGKTEEKSPPSPLKPPNNYALQMRRISSKDIYPDRETEDFEDTDEGSSDDDDDAILPGSDLRGSPKTRRKRRDSHNLLWTDDQSHASTMHHLDVFRRSKQFCDLILQVGGREIHCHRVVIGGASRFLYKELVQGENENNSNPIARISLNQIQPLLSPDAVESLVDYMYTGKLMIPQGHLTSVYSASVRLRVERVMPVCRRHISNQFNADSCVETWRLASSVGDLDLLTVLNEYIEENFDAVAKSNEFLALPRIKMVVIASNLPNDTSPFHVLPRDLALSNLAMSWVKGMIQKHGGRYMEELTEQIQRITVEELSNTIPVSRIGSSSSTSNSSSPGTGKQTAPIFHISNDGNSAKTSQSQRLSRTSSVNSISSSSSDESTGQGKCKPEGQWKVLASMQAADHTIALCSFGDILSSMTLHVPTNLVSNGSLYITNGSHSNSVSTSSSSSHSCTSSVGSVSDLSHLSQARCAGGVTVLGGKIYAMGGYNQSECLDSVECFDPSGNKWSMVAKMAQRRARFNAVVLFGEIYVVGGSTGSRDLLTVERYNPGNDKWFDAPPLPISCSGVGVAVMNNKMYCVGGVQQSTGVAGIKLCFQFDPIAQEWSYIAKLNTGRSFSGVAELNGVLYCVGGTDGWMCLTSVERFNGDSWIRGPNLNVPRRGAGLVKHNDMLFCVGGSDGGSFWTSVEQYVPEVDTWTLVPANMTVPRSNVGLVSLNGLLFAVGGFSGRHFLNSMETLDESGDEWTTHDTHMVAVSTSLSAVGDDNCNQVATS